MRLSALITAVLGLAVAGGSAFMARDYLETQNTADQAAQQVQMIDVIVAGQDIAFGQPLEAQLLTSIAWPSNSIPVGTFTEYATLLPAPGGEPRRAKKSISQGELILLSKVSEFGEKVTIVQSLGPNQRAMAIKVSAETAVGGFVTPGDFVDIVLTQGRDAELRAVTIMQNIRVIGVDQDANEQSDTPKITRTVTVEVSPEQGQKLALAQQAGQLSLTLRNLDAVLTDKPLDSIRLSDVMQDLSPVPDDAPKKTITVRRGTDVQQVESK